MLISSLTCEAIPSETLPLVDENQLFVNDFQAVYPLTGHATRVARDDLWHGGSNR